MRRLTSRCSAVQLQRGPDAELDAPDGVVDPLDGALLAPAEVVLGLGAGWRRGAGPWTRSTSRRRPCRPRPPRTISATEVVWYPLAAKHRVACSMSCRRRSWPRGVSRRAMAVHGRQAAPGGSTAVVDRGSRHGRGGETPRSRSVRTVPAMRTTYILRVWMPDRPGALGALASRIGAVGGDVIGIDILERGAGRAVDELVIELPDDDPPRSAAPRDPPGRRRRRRGPPPAADALHDPRLDALETAAILVGAPTPEDGDRELCAHAVRTVGAAWGAVVDLDAGAIVVEAGRVPRPPAGSWPSWPAARPRPGWPTAATDPADVAWAPLPSAGLALVLGRNGTAFRARERRQAAALARIVDTRFRELKVTRLPAWPTPR